jgi:transcriptional regulator with XRE-family HTH domain
MMSMDGERYRFGDLLRRHRLAAGLTQEELAEHAGLSVRAVIDLERSARRFPYPNTIARLSDALQLGAEEREQLRAAGRRPTKPARSTAPRHTLWTPQTSFVGRERELNEIGKAVESFTLTTVVGVGGVGKSRVALQVAAEHLHVFVDVVFFRLLWRNRGSALISI